MRFVLPPSPEAGIRMHSEWLVQVRMALQEISSGKDKLLPELQRHEALMVEMRSDHPELKAQIRVVAELRQSKKDLRMKELCLREQAKRLEERILSLQTGSSTSMANPGA